MSDGDLGDEPNRREFVLASTSAAAVQLSGVRTAQAAPVEAPHALAPERSAAEAELVLTINGARHTLTVEPRVTLLDALRDRAGLTGTKKGCDQGTCGACTVHVGGRRIVSCLTLAVMHDGDEIVTIEGLARGEQLDPVQAAFIEHDGFQCGYCTPGQIMSATAFLAEGHALDRETIRTQMSGNICRCGCYPHIVDAILEAGGTA